MCRLLALLVGIAVASSSLAWAEQREEKAINAARATDYIDMGIRLIVVERDDVNGTRLVPGNTQRLREVDRYERGGIVKLYLDADGKRAAHIVGKSRSPATWYASRAQADLILHDGDAQWALVQGSEGSGKTTVLAMWVAFRVLEHIGFNREIGISAPTGPRIENVRKEIAKYWPPRWFTWSERHRRYSFHAGPVVQFLSGVARSKDLGSQIQGNNWVAAASDELQDHFDEEPNIEARGRSAPDVTRNGRFCPAWYPRLCTSTFKDSSEWRTFRAACVANSNAASPTWCVTKLLGMDSPFVSPAHWIKLRDSGTMTPREFQRRVLAMEVGPESQLYHCWRRATNDNEPLNMRPLPLGHVDVTAEVLAASGPNIQLLIGHDPGKRQHVSVFLKAYRFPEDVRRGDMRPRWFVVDGVTSPDTTMHSHVQEVLKRVRDKWSCNQLDRKGNPEIGGRQALVRIDPHTRSGDEHPGRDVYTIWRQHGLIAKAAAYKPNSIEPMTIKVESRIDLINTLLCATDARGEVRRLFVLCDDKGVFEKGINRAVESLVDAFESMERNEAGKAEWEDKDKTDKSHWPAALGYAVWHLEAPRLGMAA